MVITLMRDVAEQLRIPRSLFVRSPFGSPMGSPGDAEGQTRVLSAALQLLVSASEVGIIAEAP